MYNIFESCQFINEGLFDKFKKSRSDLSRRKRGEKNDIKEISYSEFSNILRNMEYIRDRIAEAMIKDAEKYEESYPDGVIKEYDANYWKQYVRKTKTCKPIIFCDMNYDYDDADFDEDSIEHVLNTIYNAAEQLGFRFNDRDRYAFSEPNDKYPNISIFVCDDAEEGHVGCSVSMFEKVTIK